MRPPCGGFERMQHRAYQNWNVTWLERHFVRLCLNSVIDAPGVPLA